MTQTTKGSIHEAGIVREIMAEISGSGMGTDILSSRVRSIIIVLCDEVDRLNERVKELEDGK